MRDFIIFVAGIIIGLLLTGGGWILTVGIVLGIALAIVIVVLRAIRPPERRRRGG